MRVKRKINFHTRGTPFLLLCKRKFLKGKNVPTTKIWNAGGNMIKGKIMNKKSMIIAFLLALCMSFTAFAFGRTTALADDLEKVDDKPAENVMLDMDGTQSWLEVNGAKVGTWTDFSDAETRKGNIHKDNAIPGLFAGAEGNSYMMWTGGGGVAVVKLNKAYKAENFSEVRIKLAVGVKGDATGYALADTEKANAAGTVTTAAENENVILSLDASKLANADGYIEGFTLETSGKGNDFADYVELVLVQEPAPTANVVIDMNGVDAWLEIDGSKDSDKLHKGAEDDNVIPGLFPGADNSTKMMFTEGLGNEAAFTIKFSKKIKAEYFEKIKVGLAVGNWADTGNAVTTTAYALSDTSFSTPAGKIKTLMGNVYKVLAIDPALVADSEGYIEGFVLRKTETDTAASGQYFVDGVEFCLVGSEPKPVISEEFTTKDIAEVMPVGGGVTFNVATSAGTLNKSIINAAVKAGAFDKLNLKITPNSDGKFSTYILMKAPTAAATYEDGGIFFWISDDNVVIGNKDNSESVVKAEFPENAFVSGRATKISIAAIPYYIEGTQAGYYCALYVEDATDPLVEIYLGIEDVTTGVYTNICTQDLGGNYSVTYGSASDTPKSASEVMNVKIATKSGNTTFTNPRAALELDYFEVEGATVSDLVIDGDATFDKETGFLTFNDKGTVKVKYTVTNAFGTFESNELTITYDDGKTENKKKGCKGCSGSVAGTGIIGLAALGMIAVAAKKRKK